MKRMIYCTTSLLLLCPLILSTRLLAQNSYWTQQYGPRSSLMSGAVVAGVRDNSALYYNPGALGFNEHNHLSISANAYGMDIIDLQNAVGTELDLKSTRPYLYPQFISGLIHIKKLERLKMAYGLLTRYSGSVRMLTVNEMVYDVVTHHPGLEYYRSKLEYELNNQSLWGGIGIAYKINDKWSVGVTTFINYLHLDDRLSIDLQSDGKDSIGTYSAIVRSGIIHSLDNFGINWKLGVAIDLKRVKLGFSFTTPSVSMFGWGRMSRWNEMVNMNRVLPPPYNNDIYPSYLLSDDNKNLQATYYQPMSIGTGFEYWFDKTKLCFATEFFFPVAKYDVMNSGQPTILRPIEDYGDTVNNYMRTVTNTVAVFNAAIGIEHKINDKFDFYAGVRTDYNNTKNLLDTTAENGTSINPSFWHYFHFNLGATFHRGASDITFGVNYGLGLSTQNTQIINMSDPQSFVIDHGSVLFLQGYRGTSMHTNVHSIGIVLGFTYYMKRPTRKSDLIAE